MKLYEILEIMELNGNQVVNVCYRNDNDELVSYAEYDGRNSIDEKYNEAEVIGIGLGVDKYLRPRIDVIIEKVKTNKRYTVRFEIPTSWVDFDYTEVFEFEDDEDEDDIEEAIKEKFEEWIDDTLSDLREYAEKEVEEIEEY